MFASLEDLFVQCGVNTTVSNALLADGWSLTTWASCASSLEAFDAMLPSLVDREELPLLQQAALRAAFKQAAFGSSPSATSSAGGTRRIFLDGLIRPKVGLSDHKGFERKMPQTLSFGAFKFGNDAVDSPVEFGSSPIGQEAMDLGPMALQDVSDPGRGSHQPAGLKDSSRRTCFPIIPTSG